MILPTLKRERELWGRGIFGVAGVDEVGVGAWAGPLVAGAVRVRTSASLKVSVARQKLKVKSQKSKVEPKVQSFGLIKGLTNRQKFLGRVRDSKLMGWKEREEIANFLIGSDWLEFAVGIVEVREIDEWGLGEARRVAMRRAVENLEGGVDFLLIDALKLLEYKGKSESIIKGDQKVFSIASASIIAKVTRDRMMRELAREFPYWGFDKHKGYGTIFHQEMIGRYGVGEMHRKSFNFRCKM